MSRILLSLIAVLCLASGANARSIVWPVASRGISGTFGELRDGHRYHMGTDVISCGEAVRASINTNGGVVTLVQRTDDLAGNVVHIDGYFRYLHLANDAVFHNLLDAFAAAQRSGDPLRVAAGDIIGTSGNTGGVPCHLHFEMGAPGSEVNPLAHFSNPDVVNGIVNIPIMLRQGANLHEVSVGTALSLTGNAEILVRANDLSNARRNVNWERFRSTLNNRTVLRNYEFLSHAGMSANPADVYSTANPASTVSPFITWYRMGTIDLTGGQHEVCLEGFDLNSLTSRPSQSACINFWTATTPPRLTLTNADGERMDHGSVSQNAVVTLSATRNPAPVRSIELFTDNILTDTISVFPGRLDIDIRRAFAANAWYYGGPNDEIV